RQPRLCVVGRGHRAVDRAARRRPHGGAHHARRRRRARRGTRRRDPRRPRARAGGHTVTWFGTFRTGVEAARLHRLRSALTVLGMRIGIAAVMLTVGLGEGAQSDVRDQINALGSNLLIIQPGSSTGTNGVRGGFGSASTLTATDASALTSKTVAPDIAAVAPTTSSSATLTTSSNNWSTSGVGTTAPWLHVRPRKLSSGRFLSDTDVTNAAPVVVLGSSTAEELFPIGNAVGQTVTVNGVDLQVVGVLASTGSTGNSNDDDQAIVPIGVAAQQLFGGNTRSSVSTISVEAACP